MRTHARSDTQWTDGRKNAHGSRKTDCPAQPFTARARIVECRAVFVWRNKKPLAVTWATRGQKNAVLCGGTKWGSRLSSYGPGLQCPCLHFFCIRIVKEQQSNLHREKADCKNLAG